MSMSMTSQPPGCLGSGSTDHKLIAIQTAKPTWSIVLPNWLKSLPLIETSCPKEYLCSVCLSNWRKWLFSFESSCSRKNLQRSVAMCIECRAERHSHDHLQFFATPTLISSFLRRKSPQLCRQPLKGRESPSIHPSIHLSLTDSFLIKELLLL
jgi:hypothetical protein